MLHLYPEKMRVVPCIVRVKPTQIDFVCHLFTVYLSPVSIESYCAYNCHHSFLLHFAKDKDFSSDGHCQSLLTIPFIPCCVLSILCLLFCLFTHKTLCAGHDSILHLKSSPTNVNFPDQPQYLNTFISPSASDLRWSYHQHITAQQHSIPTCQPHLNMASFTTTFTALVAFVSLFTSSYGHSWVEEVRLINANGTFAPTPGYARGNVKRGPGFNDDLMTNRIPPTGRATGNEILKTDPMCMKSQQTQTQTDGSPVLNAAPGSFIALRYEENGHVTLPQNQLGKPPNRGTVYIYGTTQSSPSDTLLGIHKVWNAQGTGGDKRGKLLATQNFDDGRCYQINGGAISSQRQKEFPHQADPLMGQDLWCQNDIALPSDAPSGKLYTLYWVWDWPTLPNIDPNLKSGKPEIYTTCLDIAVDSGSGSGGTKPQKRDTAAKYAQGQSLNEAAIPSYFADLSKGSNMASQSSSPEPQASAPPSSQIAGPQTSASPKPSSAPAPAAAQPVTVTVTASAPAQTVTVTKAGQEPQSPSAVIPGSPPAAVSDKSQSTMASAVHATVPISGNSQSMMTVSIPFVTPSAIAPAANPSPAPNAFSGIASNIASSAIAQPTRAPIGPATPTSLVKSFSGVASNIQPSAKGQATATPAVPDGSKYCASCRPVKRSRIFGRS